MNYPAHAFGFSPLSGGLRFCSRAALAPGLLVLLVVLVSGCALSSASDRPRALTNPDESCESPSWSTTGKEVVLACNSREQAGTVVRVSVSSPEKRETLWQTRPGSLEQLSWSPQGDWLAFYGILPPAEERAPAPWGIGTIRPDGQGMTLLVQEGRGPSWSPDGQWIAFARGDGVLSIIHPDGTAETQLPTRAAVLAEDLYGNSLSWSPDGSRIAFVSGMASIDPWVFETDICTINVDGSGETDLTQGPAVDLAPAWSPDGSRIAFISDRESRAGTFKLYVMGADGANPTRVVPNDGAETAPAWSPDGSRLGFLGPGRVLSVANVDGSGQKVVANVEGCQVHDYAWSPDGKQIAFTCCEGGCDGGNGTRRVYVVKVGR